MRIAVIGGGAAGFFGAISIAERSPEATIVLYEATSKPLAKVRISGGGRCNVTHHCFDPATLCQHYPSGNKELRGPFNRFQPRDTVDWFEKHGVRLKTESDGRMFPVSDNSETIVSCLLTAARNKHIDLRCRSRVKDIRSQYDNFGAPAFVVTCNDGSQDEYDRLLLTTGSNRHGHQFAETLGHTIVPCVPSLFTFKIDDPRLEDLAGVSFETVALTLKTNTKKALRQSGPLLITHWGLSGPAILKLSAWGARALYDNHYTADLTVNFLPHLRESDLLETIRARKAGHPKKHVAGDNLFAPSASNTSGAIPNRYWKRIVAVSGGDESTTWATISGATITSVITELRQARFAVHGKGIFKDEFVTCGGVKLSEVDFRTMQSKVCPGLFFAGEVLDIDGITGGFNFQSAWTTGWIAGNAIATAKNAL